MFDSIIVGTGPAGLSAAINLKTYRKDFLWFGSAALSDKLLRAERIMNYPGFPSVTGEELGAHFREHVKAADLEITEKHVTNILEAGGYFMVLADGEIFEARTLILAAGVMADRLLDGEEALLGRGVSYCATCDGALYKGKRIAVLSNSPRFEHEVEYLADLADTVLYYPSFKSTIRRENVILSEDRPKAVSGEGRLDTVVLGSGKKEAVDGLFCLRNALAPSSLMPGIALSEGHIAVDRRMATNFPGCFACGDCTGRPYQFTKAVGEGNVAAHSVIEYLAAQTAH